MIFYVCFEYFLKIEYLEQERQSSAALKEETQALKEQITNKEDVLKELESNFTETYLYLPSLSVLSY